MMISLVSTCLNRLSVWRRSLPAFTLATGFLASSLGSVTAATYYIDHSGGRDNGPGNKTKPWKRHPYMKGWSGTYTHSPGDRFIFKGGVTWPATAFQMLIVAGGTSEDNRDYYGVDPTWFTGPSFTPPLFDFQNVVLSSGGGTSLSGLRILDASYITIDGIEFARHRVPHPSANVGLWGASTIVFENASSYITINNCVIRDWDQPLPVPSGADGGGGIANVGSGGGAGIKILGCTLHQAGTAAKTGRAISIYAEIAFNTIHSTVNAILGSGEIHDNRIYNITTGSDPGNHPNAVETFSPSHIYNNVIRDLSSGAAAIFVGPDSFNPTTQIDLIYNNVIYNCGFQDPIQVDTNGRSPNTTGARIFNNTLEHGNTYCVRVVYRTSAPLGTLDVRNNHFITSSDTPVLYNNPSAGGGYVVNATISDNTLQTQAQANAAGMFASQEWAPNSNSTPLYNTGVDLSEYFVSSINGIDRPSDGAWDRGAYEYEPIVAFSLSVASSNPDAGVPISLNPPDETGAVSGVTAFSATYEADTVVTLTAPPSAAGNVFAGWELDGQSAGAAPTLSVTMDAPHSVRAIYAPPVYTLTVTSQTPNSGVLVTITDGSGQAGVPTPFTRSYTSGTTVTLQAPATAGANTFQKWQIDGVDAGSSSTLVVTMAAAHTVKAVYRRK